MKVYMFSNLRHRNWSGKQFSSTNTKKTYVMRHHLDCDSQFVIYLGTCQRCHGQHVGKSETPFKRRHSNHKQKIKKKIGGLGNHCGGQGCSYEYLKIQIIDKVELGNSEALAATEVYCQNQVREYMQNGGQSHGRRK